VPDGIIAQLTKECGENVHDSHIVDVTSFEKETCGVFGNCHGCAARSAAGLECVSSFLSLCRAETEKSLHTGNKQVRFNVKERRIVSPDCRIRMRCLTSAPSGS
jgi:hypothetical protein